VKRTTTVFDAAASIVAESSGVFPISSSTISEQLLALALR